jgi:hypothetical protein
MWRRIYRNRELAPRSLPLEVFVLTVSSRSNQIMIRARSLSPYPHFSRAPDSPATTTPIPTPKRKTSRGTLGVKDSFPARRAMAHPYIRDAAAGIFQIPTMATTSCGGSTRCSRTTSEHRHGPTAMKHSRQVVREFALPLSEGPSAVPPRLPSRRALCLDPVKGLTRMSAPAGVFMPWCIP